MNLGELGVILLVAVAVFSPKHLPELAKTLSKAVTRVRQLSAELKSTLDSAVATQELAEKEKRAAEVDKLYLDKKKSDGDHGGRSE